MAARRGLAAMKNVCDVFFSALDVWHDCGLPNSLTPFDILFWAEHRSDDTLRLGNA